MWLLSIRVSRPGQLPRSRAAYGFQPQPSHPKLSCGYAHHGGRGLTGNRTIRSKGKRLSQTKFKALFELAAGQFTLAIVAFWQPRALLGGAVMLLRSAIGSWAYAPAIPEALPLAYIQSTPPTAAAENAMQPQPH
jgi:hypothetical protein